MAVRDSCRVLDFSDDQTSRQRDVTFQSSRHRRVVIVGDAVGGDADGNDATGSESLMFGVPPSGNFGRSTGLCTRLAVTCDRGEVPWCQLSDRSVYDTSSSYYVDVDAIRN